MTETEELTREFKEELDACSEAAVRTLVSNYQTGMDRITKQIEQKRASGLTEIATKRAELHAEIQAMYGLTPALDSHVELNVGGHRYSASVATLRSKQGTMLDAMFSGRYELPTTGDNSVFIDRDGSTFHYVLEYLRDGVVSVDASDGPQVLRQLKREFAFYRIELRVPKPMAIVVGPDDTYGGGGGGASPSVEIYDPVSDTWTNGSPMHIDSDRDSRVCVVAGDVYAFGGTVADRCVATVQKYIIDTDTWVCVCPMPDSRKWHEVCPMGRYVYVISGVILPLDEHEDFTPSCLRYDTYNDTWTTVTPMPGDGKRGCAVCAIDKEIYVIGGASESHDGNCIHSDDVYVYNTERDEWNLVAQTPHAIRNACVCVLGGNIYVMGGAMRDDARINTVRVYDPVLSHWSTVACMLRKRVAFSSFVLNGCIYAVGGSHGGPDVHCDSMEMYNPATDSWSEVSPTSSMRFGCTGYAFATTENLFDSLLSRCGK